MTAPITFKTKSQAAAYVGGLSEPSKMPGKGASTPARACITGAKLRNVEGSTCAGCYAMKGRYAFNVVQDALQRRLEDLQKPFWVEAMAKAIAGDAYFRWHDSGDLQGVWHLRNICEVARLTPETKHWLPTREYGFVTKYLSDGGTVPENLTIRLSEHMLDTIGPAASLARKNGLVSSAVEDKTTLKGRHCPAPSQGNKCGDCRSCWDQKVDIVIYHRH